jgi:hypothetical protein
MARNREHHGLGANARAPVYYLPGSAFFTCRSFFPFFSALRFLSLSLSIILSLSLSLSLSLLSPSLSLSLSRFFPVSQCSPVSLPPNLPPKWLILLKVALG